MIIHVLALNELFDTGLSTLLDAFAAANELGQAAGIAPQFAVSVVGVRKHVKTAQGLIVPVKDWKDLPRPDIAIVPALSAKTPETLPGCAGAKGCRGGLPAPQRLGSRWRPDRRRLHRHFHSGRIPAPRRRRGDDQLVAGAVVSRPLSARQTR